MYFQEGLTVIASHVTAYLTTILCFIITFIFLTYSSRPPKNFPPGPRGFPIVGVAPFIEARIEKSLVKWRRTYGNLFGFKIGTNLTVVLNTYELMQDAFVKNAMSFSDRPENFFFREIWYKRGFAVGDYTESYIKERKFASACFSKLGFGKTLMENVVLDEARRFVNLFSEGNVELDDKAQRSLKNAIANIVCHVLLGKRYEFEDPEFQELSTAFMDFFHRGAPAYQMTLVLPWTRYLPPLRGSVEMIKKAYATIHRIIRQKIREHNDTLDKNNPRDFIDEFLIEQKARGDPDKNLYSNETLLCSGRDLFGGGMETVHTTLFCAVIVLANRPKVQNRMHEEIDDVIGTDGIPKYALREKMPYCHAVLKEVMRYEVVAPVALPHWTSDDVVFHGYNIPKGTTVLPNIYAVHRDPEIWKDPDEFRPDRHLDADGKVMFSKYLIPFGVGSRMCIARRLAEVELFVFMVTMLQKFYIVPTPVPGCEKPHVPEESSCTGMTMLPPEDAHVTLVHRQ